MNKSQRVLRSIVSMTTVFVVFSFVFLASGVYAASTIGTNLSTTGTFLVNPAANSTTSVRFQNAAGTNYFFADSTNRRIGIGAAPSTKFEVQGTASASYFLTGNTIQVGGYASVSYNRLGTTATTEGHYISTSNDLMIGGDLEGRGSISFAGPASISNAFYVSTQGKTGNVGVGTTTPKTKFDLVGKASISSNFQMSGRFVADTGASHSFAGDLKVTSNLIVGKATASQSSGKYTAEFAAPGTATVSILFGGSTASSKGTCFQVKSTTGVWRYVRILGTGTSFTINGTPCHR